MFCDNTSVVSEEYKISNVTEGVYGDLSYPECLDGFEDTKNTIPVLVCVTDDVYMSLHAGDAIRCEPSMLFTLPELTSSLLKMLLKRFC